MKKICTAFAAALSACCIFASVPVRWTVETSRIEPLSIEAYHGESLDIEARFKSYGVPLDLTGKTANLFFRTANMPSNVYWIAPASVSNNTVRATFDGSLDPGEGRLYGFLGVQGELYRASFTMRLLSSPGWQPTAVNLPTKYLDFDQITVDNAPYYTKAESDALITNRVTKEYVEGLGISSSGQGGISGDLTEDVHIRTYDAENEAFYKIDFHGADLRIMSIDSSYDFGGVLIGGALAIEPDASFSVDATAIVNVHGSRTFEEYGLSSAAASISAAIPPLVTNTVREVQNTIFDERLGVTWRFVMDNGHLYTVAVTNTDITAVGR